jgi:hypothetical protein
MRTIIEKFSTQVFFGYTLLFQPVWAYLAARWLTRHWVVRKRPLLGWLIGLGSLAGIFFSGWAAIDLRLRLSHQWYGDCPTCYEYTGLSYLIHYGSGILSLIIFLLTAIRVTRQNRPVA